MHPRSAVSLRIEDAAPTKTILVCCLSLLPSPCVPQKQPGQTRRTRHILLLCRGPGHPAIMAWSAVSVEFVSVDPDYKRRLVARNRRSSIWLRTTVPADVKLPYDLGSTR